MTRLKEVSQEARDLILGELKKGKTRSQVADLLNSQGIKTPYGGNWNNSYVSHYAISFGLRKLSRVGKKQRRSLAMKKSWAKRRAANGNGHADGVGYVAAAFRPAVNHDLSDIEQVVSCNLPKELKAKLLAGLL